MNRAKTIKLALQGLGPLIFVYILFQIDYQLLWYEAQTVSWGLLLAGIFLVALEIVMRSFCWREILLSLDLAISKPLAVSMFWLGLFVGIITPGRLGELIKVYFLKSRGYSAFRSFLSVVLDRIFIMLVLLLCGAFIAFFFLPEVSWHVICFAVLLASGALAASLLMNKKSVLHRFFNIFLEKVFARNFDHYSRFTFAKLWRGVREMKKGRLVSFTVYTAAAWSFYFAARYMVVLAMDLDLSLVDMAAVSVAVSIVGTLPISVAGLGTREAAVIYLFGLFGLTKETALLFALFIFVIDLLAIALGVAPYLKEIALVNKAKEHA